MSDKIFDLSAFEKFLHDKIKVENRVGNLGDSVAISQVGDGKIEVVTHIPFSGRYLKYLYVGRSGRRRRWMLTKAGQDEEVSQEAAATGLAASSLDK